MLTRIDHVMVCVRDLDQAIGTYRQLGFHIYPGGIHPGRGTHNAIAFFESDYLELLAVRDPAEAETALLAFLERGEGLRNFIVASDDLERDVAAMRRRGVDIGAVRDGSRKTADGALLQWRYAYLGPRNPLPLFLIQHLTPIEERRAQVPSRNHPNGATGIAGVVIAGGRTPYETVLGVSPETLGITVASAGPTRIHFHSEVPATVPPREACGVELAFI